MKRLAIGIMFLTVTVLAALTTATAEEMSDASSAVMTINRFVTCEAIQDREPAGETDAYGAGTETAFAFLEATDISGDVQVDFVWLYQGEEVARVALNIRQGSRWRTYSSKKLAGRPGAWQVQVQDAQGTVLASRDFTVE